MDWISSKVSLKEGGSVFSGHIPREGCICSCCHILSGWWFGLRWRRAPVACELAAGPDSFILVLTEREMSNDAGPDANHEKQTA